MAIPVKVLKFLEKAKVKYEPAKHKKVYTAYDKAATLRVPLKIVGKTLVVKLDRNLALFLIPANKNLDKRKLKAKFVSERVIKNKLKGVKVGAIPPFGSLWKLLTYVDRTLLKAPKIFVNAGDYNWSLKINPASLRKLLPSVILGNFSKAKGKR